MLKIVLIVCLAIAAVLCAVFLYHRIKLVQERAILQPLGELVEVDGHRMSIYQEGQGNKTLVFLSGGGTCSPILDFKSLYSLLSDDCRIVVVEKFGYGFSDVVDEERPIDVILSQTRAALTAAGVTGPYILCPHSMSGLEALYWAQRYPDEVEAVVGLDMAVPPHYEEMEISLPLIRLGKLAADMGLTRLIPGISEGDAVLHGTLTEEEKAVYRAAFFSRTATVTMIREVEAVRENAEMVSLGGIPSVPMLLFLSDGSGGTGFDTRTWRQIPKDYLGDSSNVTYVELDCPHYVHNYEHERINREIRGFLDRQ